MVAFFSKRGKRNGRPGCLFREPGWLSPEIVVVWSQGGQETVTNPSRESAIAEEARRARTADPSQIGTLLHHRSREVLEALLENPRLGERQVGILLSRRDLAREIVARIAENREWMKSYPLKLAVVRHPRTPRHLALPLLKYLYLFDLLAVAATAGTPLELKRQAEEAILLQREGLALGQRLSLARRGSHRIAAGMLLDFDRRVIDAALMNPAMTEHAVARALLDRKAHPALTEAVVEHELWSARYGVKLALLRAQHLSLGRVMSLLPDLAQADLDDLAEDPRVRGEIRAYVAKLAQTLRVRKAKKSFSGI
jgi:hypothetical protein